MKHLLEPGELAEFNSGQPLKIVLSCQKCGGDQTFVLQADSAPMPFRSKLIPQSKPKRRGSYAKRTTGAYEHRDDLFCPVCKKQARTIRGLSHHRTQMRHWRGAKPTKHARTIRVGSKFLCPFCRESFNDRYSIGGHMAACKRKHNGQAPQFTDPLPESGKGEAL